MWAASFLSASITTVNQLLSHQINSLNFNSINYMPFGLLVSDKFKSPLSHPLFRLLFDVDGSILTYIQNNFS
ncbi:hypothetical protein BpHYR1_003755 [Brachionus plicatilis]|uniref:Uncharacterized protein n=1 Tax=Brachionus plicatilis TaxID=10195 RepID=A0A3M7P6T7_BRAPC|nr:hypothetical protein BpHYR1_003755 [Brachionus plicatilis]